MWILMTTLYYFVRILDYAIFAFCILSWFASSNQTVAKIYWKLGKFLYPLFTPARIILSKIYSRFNLYLPIDFTPWLTMILINLVYNIIIRILSTIAYVL